MEEESSTKPAYVHDLRYGEVTPEPVQFRYRFLETFYGCLSSAVIGANYCPDKLTMGDAVVGIGTPTKILARHTWFTITPTPDKERSFTVSGTFTFGAVSIRRTECWMPKHLDDVKGLLDWFFEDMLSALIAEHSAVYS